MMGTMPPLSVWWDLSTCPLPLEMDPSLLSPKMQSVFLDHGLSPAIDTFSAYADASHLPFSLQKALVDAGIGLHHMPQGQTGIKGFAMVVDMLIWVLEHQAPANIVVITSNTELANPLHKLRMKCYNIILIIPQLDLKSSFSLTNAATLVLLWPSLHILPEAMKHQVLSCKSHSTLFVDDSLMANIDNNNNNASRKRPPEHCDIINLKKRKIDDDNSLKRPDLDSLCRPPSNASQEEKAEQQGMISAELMELKKVEAWLQSLMKSKAAAHGIPISSLSNLFMREIGGTHKLKEVLGNKKLGSSLLKFQHIIKLKLRGKEICVFPVISQKYGMIMQEATQMEKVKGEGTTHIPLIEPSESRKAKKRKKVEYVEQLADNSAKRAALVSPYIHPLPPTNASPKKKAKQQGSKESLISTEFEPWLQSVMQTKKAAAGILVSYLGQLFKQESGVAQKLGNFLGEKTIVIGLLKFPHIIRLERHGTEFYAFPVISQKDDMIMHEAGQTEKVKEEDTTHIPLIETGKVKKRIVTSPKGDMKVSQAEKVKDKGISHIPVIGPSKTGKAKKTKIRKANYEPT